MAVTTRRAVVGGAALLAAGTVAAAALLRKPAPVIHSLVAEPAPSLLGVSSIVPTVPAAPPPAFSFFDATGATHTLAEFAGKGVVLNFWATWCMPCVAELPSLAALAAKLSGVVVLPVSTDRGGAAVVEGFYRTHGIAGLGIWLDPKGTASDVLRLRGLPTTLIIDREGRERGRLEGGADWGSAAAVAEIGKLVG